MNNEPVAWFEQDPDMKSVWYQADKDAPNAIPLYTHPAKPLSNVVVASATCSCGKVMKVTNLQEAKTLTDEEILVLYEEFIETQYVSESNVLGFGRAILRKAQEK